MIVIDLGEATIDSGVADAVKGAGNLGAALVDEVAVAKVNDALAAANIRGAKVYHADSAPGPSSPVLAALVGFGGGVLAGKYLLK